MPTRGPISCSSVKSAINSSVRWRASRRASMNSRVEIRDGLMRVVITLSDGLRAAKPGDHPSLVRMKEVSVGCADVRLRSRVRTASQDFLADKPLVVILVKLGFESGIRNVIGRGPLPHVADHLIAAVCASPCGQ